jgi:hypothetical protein
VGEAGARGRGDGNRDRAYIGPMPTSPTETAGYVIEHVERHGSDEAKLLPFFFLCTRGSFGLKACSRRRETAKTDNRDSTIRWSELDMSMFYKQGTRCT